MRLELDRRLDLVTLLPSQFLHDMRRLHPLPS